jgi:hypothetical protein
MQLYENTMKEKGKELGFKSQSIRSYTITVVA